MDGEHTVTKRTTRSQARRSLRLSSSKSPKPKPKSVARHSSPKPKLARRMSDRAARAALRQQQRKQSHTGNSSSGTTTATPDTAADTARRPSTTITEEDSAAALTLLSITPSISHKELPQESSSTAALAETTATIEHSLDVDAMNMDMVFQPHDPMGVPPPPAHELPPMDPAMDAPQDAEFDPQIQALAETRPIRLDNYAGTDVCVRRFRMTEKQVYSTTLTYNAKHGNAIPEEEHTAFSYTDIKNRVIAHAMKKQSMFLGHSVDGKPPEEKANPNELSIIEFIDRIGRKIIEVASKKGQAKPEKIQQAVERANGLQSNLRAFVGKYGIATCGELRQFMINRTHEWFTSLHQDVRKDVWSNLWLRKGAKFYKADFPPTFPTFVLLTRQRLKAWSLGIEPYGKTADTHITEHCSGINRCKDKTHIGKALSAEECFPCHTIGLFRKTAVVFGMVSSQLLSGWTKAEAHYRTRYLQALIGVNSRVFTNAQIVNCLRVFHKFLLESKEVQRRDDEKYGSEEQKASLKQNNGNVLKNPKILADVVMKLSNLPPPQQEIVSPDTLKSWVAKHLPTENGVTNTDDIQEIAYYCSAPPINFDVNEKFQIRTIFDDVKIGGDDSLKDEDGSEGSKTRKVKRKLPEPLEDGMFVTTFQCLDDNGHQIEKPVSDLAEHIKQQKTPFWLTLDKNLEALHTNGKTRRGRNSAKRRRTTASSSSSSSAISAAAASVRRHQQQQQAAAAAAAHQQMAAAMSAVNPLSSLNGFAAAAPMFATPTPAAAPSPLQFAAAQSATPTSADMRLFAQQTLAAGGMPLLGAGPANSVASAAAAANSAAAAADSMKIPGVDFHKAFADATHAMFHHQAQQQAQQQQEKRDPAAAAARQLGIQDDTSSLQAAAAKRQRLNSMSGLDVFSQQQYQNHVKQAQMMQMAQLQTQLQMQQRLQQQQFLGGLGMYPGSMMPGMASPLAATPTPLAANPLAAQPQPDISSYLNSGDEDRQLQMFFAKNIAKANPHMKESPSKLVDPSSPALGALPSTHHLLNGVNGASSAAAAAASAASNMMLAAAAAAVKRDA